MLGWKNRAQGPLLLKLLFVGLQLSQQNTLYIVIFIVSTSNLL